MPLHMDILCSGTVFYSAGFMINGEKIGNLHVILHGFLYGDLPCGF